MKDQLKVEVTNIKKEIIKTQIIGALGTILVGLGLYGVFGAQGNAFLLLLNELDNCYAILVVGGAIVVWEAIRILKLTRRQSEISRQLNT
jgi:hypothetical protein